MFNQKFFKIYLELIRTYPITPPRLLQKSPISSQNFRKNLKISQEFSQGFWKIILQFLGNIPVNAKFFKIFLKFVYYSHFWTLFVSFKNYFRIFPIFFLFHQISAQFYILIDERSDNLILESNQEGCNLSFALFEKKVSIYKNISWGQFLKKFEEISKEISHTGSYILRHSHEQPTYIH